MTEDLIAQRYGRTKAAKRRTRITAWGIGIALTASFLTWAIWVNFATPSAAKGTVVGYEVIDSQHTLVRFKVSKPTGFDAACGIEVLNQAYGVVGYLQVDVPAETPATEVLEVSVNTTQEGVTGVADKCWIK